MRVRVDLIDDIAWYWLTEILKDPVKLQSEIDIYQTHMTGQYAPILEQIKIADELISENRTKLERLIDLYMSGTYSLENVQGRKSELEKRISSLENQRAELSSSLEGETLTQDQVDDLQAFAKDIGDRVDNATHEEKLQLFYMLKVEGSLTLENENKIFNVRCVLKPNAEKFMINITACSGRGSRNSLLGDPTARCAGQPPGGWLRPDH
jgi:hypothetical protein